MKDPVIRALVISLAGGLVLLGLVAYLYVWHWPHG